MTNTLKDAVNAVTWGVFPGQEIVQSTIIEETSFLAWKVGCYILGGNVADPRRRRHSTSGPNGVGCTLACHPLASCSKTLQKNGGSSH